MSLTSQQLREIDATIAINIINLKHQTFETPHYSTDIAAAWDVVEVGRKEAWFELTYYHDYFSCDGPPYKAHWACSWGQSSVENLGRGNYAQAQTAPLAICLAALKAKGIDISEWVK